MLITRTEKATTKDFQIIIKSIYENKNNSISNKYVKRHLNWIITKKNNSKFYKYFGGKGGSLIGVLTYSCFAINNANESVNFNFFINDMDFPDWYLMQDSFIEFRNRFCKSKSERDLLLSKLQ